MDRARLARLLYPDHSPFETALWVSGWTFAVGYSIYNSFLASQGELAMNEMSCLQFYQLFEARGLVLLMVADWYQEGTGQCRFNLPTVMVTTCCPKGLSYWFRVLLPSFPVSCHQSSPTIIQPIVLSLTFLLQAPLALAALET